jgi:hypothetical protein
MQFPNESNDLFILEPSFYLIALFSGSAFSLPARSTMYNLDNKSIDFDGVIFFSISKFS